MKPPELYIKIRSYDSTPKCDVWLIGKNGAAHSCRLHGEMLKQEGEELAARLGLLVFHDETKTTSV